MLTRAVPRRYTVSAMAFDRLKEEAAELGLELLPLGSHYEARVQEEGQAELALSSFWPWARGGFLLFSAGGRFFEAFSRAREAFRDRADPLDDWTRDRVETLLGPMREAGIRAEARFPFWNEPHPLPFLRIGAAAGMGAPSRLGLTLHPHFGTWIAYRALVLVDREVEDRPHTVYVACAACAAPCLPACPAGALASGNWDPSPCLAHRLASESCEAGCLSRLACPEGALHHLPDEALRFHQAASRAFARASARSG